MRLPSIRWITLWYPMRLPKLVPIRSNYGIVMCCSHEFHQGTGHTCSQNMVRTSQNFGGRKFLWLPEITRQKIGGYFFRASVVRDHVNWPAKSTKPCALLLKMAVIILFTKLFSNCSLYFSYFY